MKNTHLEDALKSALAAITGKIALAFSHQAEDVAALHMVLRTGVPVEVFTLDTLRLFPETLKYHAEAESFFNIEIKRYTPELDAVKLLEEKLGELGMRDSLEARHECCRVRKLEPLSRALKDKSAWITGLRAAQSVTRAHIEFMERDEERGIIKINPLAEFDDEDITRYIEEYNIPLSPLYAKGFKSIGCMPCTRAVKNGEDIRAGRWWWESPEHKECGLHKSG